MTSNPLSEFTAIFRWISHSEHLTRGRERLAHTQLMWLTQSTAAVIVELPVELKVMKQQSIFQLNQLTPFTLKSWPAKVICSVIGLSLLLSASPAFAHHAMGNRMPSNFFEGFLSGIAHPIIGPDHFAFIAAIGLLATTKRQGFWLPIAFVLAAMVGTGLHLAGMALPGAELFVSGSILAFGVLLTLKDQPHPFAIIMLSALAGIFHGYAYGEAIFGAGMTPVLAYLVGFTTIQLILAAGVFQIGKMLIKRSTQTSLPSSLPAAGLVLCGVGLAFLSSQIVDTIFPG